MQGIGVSPGIAIGRAIVIRDPVFRATGILLEDEDDIAQEIRKYIEAVSRSIAELKAITTGGVEGEILETHIELLSDPQMGADVLAKISRERKNARDAVLEVIGSIVQVFQDMDDEYLRQRAADVQDIGKRILWNLTSPGPAPETASPREPTSISETAPTPETPPSPEPTDLILIADDLSPSQAITMDSKRFIGFATRAGGSTSHAAIIARSKNIPAIAGCGLALDQIKDGDILILDGRSGLLLVDPSPETLAEYVAQRKEYIEKTHLLRSLKDRAAITTDGTQITLLANIATVEDLGTALEQGAEGVGLLRTELLFMGRNTFPTEDEQFAFYQAIALRSGPRPVSIRTLDIGGDKPLSYLRLPEEQNPFLGYRAIRICLDRTDIFLTQLKAILRASIFGRLQILLPMISNLREIRSAKALLAEAKRALQQQQIPFDKDIPLGIMIEIPSAAIMADLLAKEVDFFSIGTNDLCQYTLAVDRMNEKIKDLYDPFDPGVLRLIQNTILQAQKNNIPVSLCGELAADPEATALLIGMGLTAFSMNPGAIPVIKHIILYTDRTAAGIRSQKTMETYP